MEKYIPCKWEAKITGVAILISDKIDLKINNVTRDKEGYYIVIKGSIQEDITTVNISAPNIGAPQYIRQTVTDMKGEIDSNTIIVGDFNTPLTPMDRSSKQKKRHRCIEQTFGFCGRRRGWDVSREQHRNMYII